MPVEKKYLKLGVAGLAVVALVIGLSVGLTQKNKADDRSAASNVKANNNIASQAGDTCYPVGAKGGKSGARRQRRLVVPGAEDADARREELRGALQRELGTDDNMGGMATANGDSSYNGNNNGGNGNGGNTRPNRPNRGNGGNTRPNRPNGGGSNGNRGNGGKGGNNRPNGGANTAATPDDDYYYDYGDYDYEYDYDYGYGYGYGDGDGGGKSGKSGNKSGKSGGHGGDQCLPIYDPCDPDMPPPDPCWGKSGKSGSPGCAKSGKSGNKSGKSGNKSGKSGGGLPYVCPCDPCFGKSGKSGSPQCGKSGKSGNKSGKSGNKSGKSGGGGVGPGFCDCMPTLCPTSPCVCEDLPFAFVDGVCTQRCGVSENGQYADQGACCLANFPPGAGNCQVDACVETPAPTYFPTVVDTYPPTNVEDTCVCTDLPWVFDNGVCKRGCDISENGLFPTRSNCCTQSFGTTGSDCLTEDTCCDCEMLPYAFVNGRCVRGCGLSENGAYDTMGMCCDDNFGPGTGNGNSCRQTDECPSNPTPSPTAGSTPTVATDAESGWVDKGPRSEDV